MQTLPFDLYYMISYCGTSKDEAAGDEWANKANRQKSLSPARLAGPDSSHTASPLFVS